MSYLKKSSLLVLVFMLIIFQSAGFLHHASAKTLTNAVTISVLDQNDGTVVDLKAATITEGETAFEALKKVVGADKLGYTVDPTYGPFITKINGIEATQPGFWGFFINGADPGVGASSYKVKNGDDLLFKVVNYPPEMVNATVSIEGDSIAAKYQNQKVQVVRGASAYDAIKQAYKSSRIDAPIDDQYFTYIANIDQIIHDGEYFGVYFNGESASVGVSSLKVKDGDQILLKVTGTTTDMGNNTSNNQTETKPETSNQAPISKNVLNKSIKQAVALILKNGVDSPYEALGIRQTGQKVPQSYIDDLERQLKDNNGQYRNVTDYENMALGVTAVGGNAEHFAGYNLIQSIYNNPRMTNQGNNGPIYALLALDSGHYQTPPTAIWTREKLVDYLLKNQLPDGSWALFGTTGSPDMTGMALSALAPYQSESKVKNAVTKATSWLSSVQNDQGGYGVVTNGGDSSESTAQVIIGLASVGVDPAGSDFTKANHNLIMHLLSFEQKDGGFSHLLADQESNSIATMQALLALTAYQNQLNGKTTVFQVDNSGLTVQPTQAQAQTQAGEPLPNTATNAYNMIAFGLLLIIIGCAVIIYRRRRV